MTMSSGTDDILKALANPVRRKILSALKAPAQNFPGQLHPYEWGVCANRIEATCGLAQSTISAHLAALTQAGLLTSSKIGQWVFYARNEPAIAAFLTQISEDL
ncbi:helix-turn-helix transcriptional regulator [Acidocella sp.]|uniref:ArsR/SmtB family transcription factor n=1 Tax=Acidocella sp. TaxID=50710 RepID=UPI00262303F9|nr:metalloregulator ArsR/SmtB family transcription factor [Acidocella sp.]